MTRSTASLTFVYVAGGLIVLCSRFWDINVSVSIYFSFHISHKVFAGVNCPLNFIAAWPHLYSIQNTTVPSHHTNPIGCPHLHCNFFVLDKKRCIYHSWCLVSTRLAVSCLHLLVSCNLSSCFWDDGIHMIITPATLSATTIRRWIFTAVVSNNFDCSHGTCANRITCVNSMSFLIDST